MGILPFVTSLAQNLMQNFLSPKNEYSPGFSPESIHYQLNCSLKWEKADVHL